MALGSSPALLDQARSLLRDPADTNALVALAMACHRRMLRLLEGQSTEAIRHALAAAALFAAAKDQGEELPDWVQAHEEQCCREAAIGIHALVQASACPDPTWPSRAIQLLHRMEQLHPQPLAWAAAMRAALAAPAAEAPVLISANAWEPLIRAKLEPAGVTLAFADLGAVDLSGADVIIPLGLADQRYINALLPDHPRLPVIVPDERCIELCHDKPRFRAHLQGLGLGDGITPRRHAGRFPYILKPRQGEWGLDTVIIRDAAEEAAHAALIASGACLEEPYIVGDQECSTHIIATGGRIRFMGSVRFSFDSDHYVKGVHKDPIGMEIVQHGCYAPIFERILTSIGYQGFACFDYKIVDGQPCIFELNPRYGASMTTFIAQALPLYRTWIQAVIAERLAASAA